MWDLSWNLHALQSTQETILVGIFSTRLIRASWILCKFQRMRWWHQRDCIARMQVVSVCACGYDRSQSTARDSVRGHSHSCIISRRSYSAMSVLCCLLQRKENNLRISTRNLRIEQRLCVYEERFQSSRQFRFSFNFSLLLYCVLGPSLNELHENYKIYSTESSTAESREIQ